jgi:isopenicillin N synthase-like dioxygenase
MAATNSDSNSSIPVIDFSRSTTDLPALAAEIKQVCSTWGFLYLQNHSLPQETIDRLFSISATFFKTTPAEEKFSTPWNSIVNAGYDAKTGTEGYFKENGARETVAAEDSKEVFVIRKQASYDQPMPPSLKKFNPEIQAFMAEVHEKIAVPLLACLGIGLGLSETHLPLLHKHASPSMTTLRLIYYPALPADADDTAPNHVRLPSHTDQGVLTILFQNQIAGLQVRPPKYTGPIQPDEVWLDAPVIPGAVLINIGETMTFFSGGLMKSTLHRVAKSPLPQEQGKERFSMAYFCHPNMDTLLRVLDGLEGKEGVEAREAPISCVTGEKVKTVKDWIEHRHSMGRLAKVK